MPLRARRRRPVDTSPPVITGLVLGGVTTIEFDEGTLFDHLFESDEPLSRIEIQGADIALVAIDGARIRGREIWHLSDPPDADTDGDLNIQLNFVNLSGLETGFQDVVLSMQPVGLPVPGTPLTPSITVASENEIVLSNVSATGATSFQFRIDGGEWRTLNSTVFGYVIQDLQPSAEHDTPGLEIRGVNESGPGLESDPVPFTMDAAPSLYSPNAVVLNGSAWSRRGADLTGLVDSKVGTFVISHRPTAGDNTSRRILQSQSLRSIFRIMESNKLQVNGVTSAVTFALKLETELTILANSGWHIDIVSYDLAQGLAYWIHNNRLIELSIETIVNTNIDYTTGNWFLGALSDGTQGFTGLLSDLAFADVFIDLSRLVNVRNIVDINGKLRDPGANGSNWLGVAAKILFKGATADWGKTNYGTGGDFTMGAGTFTQANNSPNGQITSGVGVSVPHSEDIRRTTAINVHATWSGRWALTGWRALVGDLNILYVRTTVDTVLQAREHLKALNADYGIQAGIVELVVNADGSGKFSKIQANWDYLKANINGDGGILDHIRWYEGPNEYTHHWNDTLPAPGGTPDWVTKLTAIQQFYYNMVRNDSHPDAADIDVVATSVFERDVGELTAIGTRLAPYCDYGNLHYYNGGNPPTVYNRLDGGSLLDDYRSVVPDHLMGKPSLFITEVGASMSLDGVAAAFNQIPEDVAAKYILRYYCDFIWLGQVGMWVWYALLDNPTQNVFRHGLCDYDTFAKRKTWYTERNWLAQVMNPGTFTPSPVAFTITHGSANNRHLAYGMSDGSYIFPMWQDVPCYNRSTFATISNPTVNSILKVTSPSFSSCEIYAPTVTGADNPDTKRDTPISTPSIAALATTGITIPVADEVRIVKLIP